MKALTLLLLLIPLIACTSQTLTSESLSRAEIEAIQERVRQAHPELSSAKQHEVAELVIRAMDNMVFIEGGSFMMGEFGVPCEPGSEKICMSDYFSDNDHTHEVVLDDYYLSAYEVTLGDFDVYREVHNQKPYAQELRTREDRRHYFDPNKPAWTRTWKEARNYCQWIGQLVDRDMGLPTEAQWEFAARNRGKNILYATHNGKVEPGVNYPTDEQRHTIQPVGKYPPSPLGIYDLNANATEWIYDWYDETYYQSSEKTNPKGPPSGQEKVMRGGANYNSAGANTTLHRESRPPKSKHYQEYISFRCSGS